MASRMRLREERQNLLTEAAMKQELPKSTVNTVITVLREKGFVELVPIKGKRREMKIVLTENGKKYASELLAGIYEKEAEVFKQLNSDDLQIVNRLEKIVSLLKEKEEKQK